MRERERERERERQRHREKQAPCWEPDVGLDPGTPGSCPGPKAGAKPLSHPGIPPTHIVLKAHCNQTHDLVKASNELSSFLYPFVSPFYSNGQT